MLSAEDDGLVAVPHSHRNDIKLIRQKSIEILDSLIEQLFRQENQAKSDTSCSSGEKNESDTIIVPDAQTKHKFAKRCKQYLQQIITTYRNCKLEVPDDVEENRRKIIVQYRPENVELIAEKRALREEIKKCLKEILQNRENLKQDTADKIARAIPIVIQSCVQQQPQIQVADKQQSLQQYSENVVQKALNKQELEHEKAEKVIDNFGIIVEERGKQMKQVFRPLMDLQTLYNKGLQFA